MRQIYTSLRQENIDRVTALMNEHGIETTITNRSNYKGGDWKKFSYTNRPDASTWPQVWVVNANDQTRARELLREAGIEPPVRYADELAAAMREPLTGTARHRAVAGRMRMVALSLVAVASVLLSLRSCGMTKEQAPPQPQRQVIPVTTH